MTLEFLLLVAIFVLTSLLIWICVGLRWMSCKSFFHGAQTYFDISFILLYFLEQITLIFILTKTDYSPIIVVGIFSIVVVTTVSLQNRSWESRLNKINSYVIKHHNLFGAVMSKNKEVIAENKILDKKLNDAKQFINELFDELKKLTLNIGKSKKKR